LPDRADRPDCLFCRIAAGEQDAEIVYEDGHSLAFLDHRPLFPGHALLIPRSHVEVLADLPAELLEPFFGAAQLLSQAIPAAMDKPGSFVAVNNVVSQSVPHLHVHIVPRRPKDGLRGFFWPRTSYDSEEHLAQVGKQVRSAVERFR
jgi:histidine triad (HIT) family protein